MCSPPSCRTVVHSTCRCILVHFPSCALSLLAREEGKEVDYRCPLAMTKTKHRCIHPVVLPCTARFPRCALPAATLHRKVFYQNEDIILTFNLFDICLPLSSPSYVSSPLFSMYLDALDCVDVPLIRSISLSNVNRAPPCAITPSFHVHRGNHRLSITVDTKTNLQQRKSYECSRLLPFTLQTFSAPLASPSWYVARVQAKHPNAGQCVPA